MNRRALTAVAVVPLLLMLTACGPGDPGPTGTPSSTKSTTPSAKPTPSATPTEKAIPLPDDATMLVTATATASNGATAELRLVVHRSGASSGAGSAGRDATSAWCVGEVDNDLLDGFDYSFTQVDYSATAVSGSWPSGEAIWVHPTADYNTVTAVGDVQNIAYPRPSEAGDYVPHCAQRALLPGVGVGSTWVGISNDAAGRDGVPALNFWARLTYGFNNDPDVPTAPIGYSNCELTITALGETMGAPGAGWHQDFLPNSCIVGGMTGY